MQSFPTVPLIVKLIRIVYENISYGGNLVFTEQLFEVGESFLEQTLKKLNNKHFVPKQWMNPALHLLKLFFKKTFKLKSLRI